MRPTLRTAALVVGIVLIGIAGFSGGWLLGARTAGSGSGPLTLSIVAAGSLAPILPPLASEFANETPGVTSPISAQLYEGSSTAASALAGGQQPYDLFVSADYRTIPKTLEAPAATVASWEVIYASDPMVLAYAPSDSTLSGIDASNWWTEIVQPGVLLGAPNASADPLGYNVIFTLELEDAAQHLGGSLYGHFYDGAEGSLATPTSATVYVSENVAATALSHGTVDAFLLYRSYAVADHLTYLNLSPAVNLAATDPTNVSHYASVSTTILSGTATKSVAGAPVLFALTVPSTARNPVVGLAFAAFLLSNATSATWASDGFQPIVPMWADHLSAVPAVLAGSPSAGVVPLPSDLANLL